MWNYEFMLKSSSVHVIVILSKNPQMSILVLKSYISKKSSHDFVSLKSWTEKSSLSPAEGGGEQKTSVDSMEMTLRGQKKQQSLSLCLENIYFWSCTLYKGTKLCEIGWDLSSKSHFVEHFPTCLKFLHDFSQNKKIKKQCLSSLMGTYSKLLLPFLIF